jgi:hypothetical protein
MCARLRVNRPSLPRGADLSPWRRVQPVAAPDVYDGGVRKRNWTGCIVWAIVATVVITVVAPNFIAVKDGDSRVVNRGYSIQGLHTVALALERYSVDHSGLYPLTLQPLRDEAYLPVFPENRYLPPSARRRRQDGSYPTRHDIAMHEVPLGHHSPGCIAYIPRTDADSRVRGYALLVYGDEAARKAMLRRGEDHHCDLPGDAESKVSWEYVLLVITSGTANPPLAKPPARQQPAPRAR